MTDLTGNQQDYCQFGTTTLPGSACAGLQQINSAANILALFNGSVPAWAALIIDGLDAITILASDLCKMSPKDPGPFDPKWVLLPAFQNEAGADFVTWAIQWLYILAFNQCCACAVPAITDYTLLATFSLPCNNAGHNLSWYAVPDTSKAYNVRVVMKMSPCTTWASGFCPAMTLTQHVKDPTNGCFPGYGAGSGCIPSNYWGTACAGTPNHSPNTYVTINSTTAVAAGSGCLELDLYTPGPSQSSAEGYIYIQPIGTATLSPSPPPTTPPSLPGAGGTGVGPLPIVNGSGSCNFGGISAIAIEDLLVPNGRTTISSTSLTGTGSIAFPPTANGYGLVLTTIPPGSSHDAGDPPQRYQVGWTALSRDGVEGDGPARPITFEQQMRWDRSTLDNYLLYNLYPGYVATLHFYAPAAAPD